LVNIPLLNFIFISAASLYLELQDMGTELLYDAERKINNNQNND
jgi:hypothetical protein